MRTSLVTLPWNYHFFLLFSIMPHLSLNMYHTSIQKRTVCSLLPWPYVLRNWVNVFGKYRNLAGSNTRHMIDYKEPFFKGLFGYFFTFSDLTYITTMLTLPTKIVHAQRSAKAVSSVRPSESHQGRKPAERRKSLCISRNTKKSQIKKESVFCSAEVIYFQIFWSLQKRPSLSRLLDSFLARQIDGESWLSIFSVHILEVCSSAVHMVEVAYYT